MSGIGLLVFFVKKLEMLLVPLALMASAFAFADCSSFGTAFTAFFE
jgi:hypothetical protein